MPEYKAEPQARVLADSVSPNGHRLTTMEVTMHRFVLAEFNTHRVFSRNSASSRAIPGRLQRERVLTSPAVPLEWPEKLKGMQGGQPLGDELETRAAALWRKAALHAATTASQLDKMGVHKSVTNRLLEPFLFQTVIVSSTGWDGFFKQRDSKLAQPEIAEPARLMREAYKESTPKELNEGQWHTPLIEEQDLIAIGTYVGKKYGPDANRSGFERAVRRVSAARCARVSYLTHDGERDISKDLELYERLVTADPPHWSPLEHVATPCEHLNDYNETYDDHQGNFYGWDQLRHYKDAQ